MLIAVFSDIHGNKYSLAEFEKQVTKDHPDEIYFLGDIFGYYYFQRECIDYLASKNNIFCVCGNHDKMFLESIVNPGLIPSLVEKYGNTYKQEKNLSKENYEFLSNLSDSIVRQIDGLNLMFCHGDLKDPINGRAYPNTQIELSDKYSDYDYVFLGHTHHKMVRKEGNTHIINPGSLGQQRDGKGCSYVLFDTQTKEIKFKVIEYDKSKLMSDIKRFDPKNKKLLEVLFRNSGK